MTPSSFPSLALKNVAKELLAAAVLDLFPGTQLLGGGITESDFYYDFLFPPHRIQSWGAQESEHVENRLLEIVREKIPIHHQQMVPVSAKGFFLHHKQEKLALSLSTKEKKALVDIIQIGSYNGLCAAPFPPDTSFFNAIALLEVEPIAGQKDAFRVRGVVFPAKEELKNYLKIYREAKKQDHQLLGPRYHLWKTWKDGERIWLPRGEHFLHALQEGIRHRLQQEGFAFYRFPKEATFSFIKGTFEEIPERSLPFKAAYISPEGEICTFVYCTKENLEKELISSLQFTEETIKMFRLEHYLRLEDEGKGKFTKDREILFHSARQHSQDVRQERGVNLQESRSSLRFILLDVYKRGWPGPAIVVDSENALVYRSFRSLEFLVQLGIEKASPEELNQALETCWKGI